MSRFIGTALRQNWAPGQSMTPAGKRHLGIPKPTTGSIATGSGDIRRHRTPGRPPVMGAGLGVSRAGGNRVGACRRALPGSERTGRTVRLLREPCVSPSCRRFDKWPVWKILLWTNPVFIALFRRWEAGVEGLVLGRGPLESTRRWVRGLRSVRAARRQTNRSFRDGPSCKWSGSKSAIDTIGSMGSPQCSRRWSRDNAQNSFSAAVLPKCGQSASLLMIRTSVVRAIYSSIASFSTKSSRTSRSNGSRYRYSWRCSTWLRTS